MKTTLEISAARLAENFRAVGRVAGEDAAVLAVVKADGYGHGATMCAPVLVDAGARWLGVGDVEEGAAVRRALGSRDARIVAMCGMESGDAGAMLEHRLTPVVWTVWHVEAIEREAQAVGERVAVHLKIDSGMSRQGAQVGAPLAAVAARLAESKWLHCEGVLTHLACSEEVDSAMTAMQQERFAAGMRQVLGERLRPELVHLANTSALDEGSTTAWLRELARAHGARVMARTGLALYGHCLELDVPRHRGSESPDEGHSHLAACLKPVLHWRTVVIGVREVATADRAGYGATWTASRPTRLALLPVGYADGFRRGASSGIGDGWVVIAGQRAPVVGRVSMNLTTVDVTELPDVQEGAEVTLLGEGVSVHDHARWNGTIPYEIICGMRGHRKLV